MSNEEVKTSRERNFLTKAAGAGHWPLRCRQALQQPAAKKQSAAATKKGKRPLNVLFFMSDDMRAELASYGSRFNVHSPNIDALGAHGVFASIATTASFRFAILHALLALHGAHSARNCCARQPATPS